MGAQRNYTSLIRTILMFKSYWSSIDDVKLIPIKEVLSKYDFVENDEDWDHFPDNKKVAELIGLSRTKVNQMIFKLYTEITNQFYDTPPVINRVVHRIYIYIPFDDRRNRGKKYQGDEDIQWLDVSLPVTPKVGDKINLEFLDDTKYRRGYVHSIEHIITGYSQQIDIQVHPFDNEYERWQNLKEHHDWQERIRKN